MIKRALYILLIFSICGCANFQGKEEGQKIDRFGNTINEDGNIETAQEIYNKAKGALKREEYENAIESYRLIESNFPFSEYATQSHIELAFAEYKLKRWDSAVAIIDRFISMNNTSQLLPYAYYLRGLVNFNRGKTFFNFVLPHVQIDKDPFNLRNAYEDFNYVYKNYTKSEYVDDSLKRMIYLRNTLASYELHVANFYFKRKAYVAVINRCNYLIEKYPNSPANIDALFFLKAAYEKLLMKDNARDIEKIISMNYPDYKSIYFSDVLENKVRQNILAISETADDIAVGLGFDIEEQKVDDFTGVYNVEYFNNDNLVEIPMNIKPDRYTIVHKRNTENKKNKKEANWLEYIISDDKSDLYVKDIIVSNEKELSTNNDKVKVIEENQANEINDDQNSEEEILELIEN